DAGQHPRCICDATQYFTLGVITIRPNHYAVAGFVPPQNIALAIATKVAQACHHPGLTSDRLQALAPGITPTRPVQVSPRGRVSPENITLAIAVEVTLYALQRHDG